MGRHTITKKGFISLFVLLFILTFIFITIQHKPNTIDDFIIIEQAETKKESNILNIQEIITNSLKINTENSSDLKKEVNTRLLEYFSKEDIYNYYILNSISNTKQEVSLSKLQDISKIITYKPSKHITIKKYVITNGITKDMLLSFDINTNNYLTIYSFPENYSLMVVVYD